MTVVRMAVRSSTLANVGHHVSLRSSAWPTLIDSAYHAWSSLSLHTKDASG
ncbi:hypothetical protein HanPI659440_Chr00c09g0721151 [Helianthus annuus]|nr:hypothetical protein HanPI659440_Chr00c09g0721151 [Helianthus annuus]